jgi:hypothetical protein
MARYMRPANQLLPPGESDVHYFVQLAEDLDIELLEDRVNAYLLVLESPDLPQFALIDTEHGNYLSAAPAVLMHTVMLTFMWVAGPINYLPPSINP